MPVDKFGSMDDESTIGDIQPLTRHAYNLDDLENVEGFSDKGIINKLYLYKLNEKGIYVRTVIPDNIATLKSEMITLIEDMKGEIEKKYGVSPGEKDKQYISLKNEILTLKNEMNKKYTDLKSNMDKMVVDINHDIQEISKEIGNIVDDITRLNNLKGDVVRVNIKGNPGGKHDN